MPELGTRHLTAADVSKRLQIPVWSVYELVKRADLPVLRIGRRLRFREADIEAWEEQTVERPREAARKRAGGEAGQ